MNDEIQRKTIGKPYIREWYTGTYSVNGEMPPEGDWIKHEVEVVLIETSELRAVCLERDEALAKLKDALERIAHLKRALK